MTDHALALQAAQHSIVSAIHTRLAVMSPPMLVAVDGGSGAGKTTLAGLIARELDAPLVQSDDFFAASIPDADWNARTPDRRAADALDWRRLRSEALEPLLAGQPARWHAFDFDAVRPDGTYPMRTDFVERNPVAVIVLEGAYSTRRELSDLTDLCVLVEAPVWMRHQRLAHRDDGEFLERWHRRWDAAEAYYFAHL